ncbi:MAG TPA: ABC transporter ATP-binding protein [Thermodesulfobacteriota bacterium]|nr:ABC transporter ATP-binding protein [Thermodesulfobacteriota bacterium]
MEELIQVENLTKDFGSISALRDVSFNIERGESVGFLGPNGSGKTTTLRILTCFLPPTSGKVTVDGYDVIQDSLEVRRRIGYFPEKVPLYPWMKVSTFLDFVADVKGVNRTERRQKISETMESCGLEAVAYRTIGNLSKGYRQRVGLAQVLINDPPILILDEPTVGLDPEQIVEIRKLIKNLAKERTIFLSSHILPEVSMICNRIIIINEGKIIAEDTQENLAARLQTACQFFVKIEGPHEEVRKKLEKIPGVLKVEEKENVSENIFAYLIKAGKNVDVAREISSVVLNNRWSMLEMRQVEMNLEEIFLNLITHET